MGDDPGATLRILRVTVPLALVAVLVTGAIGLDDEHVTWVVDRLDGEWRAWAVPALILGGAALTTVGVPGTITSLAAGAAFGFALGLPAALASAFLAACATAAIGRTLGPGEAPPPPEGERRLVARIRRAVGDADWRFVALLRLCPVMPYAAVNYLLGSWRVAWPSLVLGTALGLVPGTAAHVYLAAAGRRLIGGGSLHPLEWGVLALGLLAIPLTGWWVLRRIERRGAAQSAPS